MAQRGLKALAIGSDGVTVSMDIANNNDFVVTGTLTATAGKVITTTSTPFPYQTLTLLYKARVTYNGGTVSILGTQLTQEQAKSDLFLIATFNGADWDAVILQGTNFFNDTYKAVATNEITGAASISLDPNIDARYQVITGTYTLSGTYSFEAGTSTRDGDSFFVIYRAVITGGTVSIFGNTLTDTAKLSGDLVVHAVYDQDTASYLTTVLPGVSLSLIKSSQSEAEAASNDTTAMTPLKVKQQVNYRLANESLTFAGALTIFSATVRLSNLTLSTILELDASKNIISATKNTAYNKNFGSGTGTVMQGNDVRALGQQYYRQVSFETTDLGDYDVTIQADTTITKVEYFVERALASGGAGTITLKKGTTSMATGSVSLPASTVRNTFGTITPTADNVLTVGDVFRITTAKAGTGGGLVGLIIYYTVT